MRMTGLAKGLALAAALALGACAAKTAPVKPSGPLPWSAAIGRLDSEAERTSCSASLIAPDLILTAAHCVHNAGHRIAPKDLSFTPNLGAGPRLPSSTGTDYLAVGNYIDKDDIDPADMAPFDWAIVRIAPAIDFVTPLPVESLAAEAIAQRLKAGGHLINAGYGVYGLTSGHRLKVTENCRSQLDRFATIAKTENVIATDCEVIRGDSGGPVLLVENGRHRLIGVLSGYWAIGNFNIVSFGPSATAFAAKLPKLAQ